MATIPKTLHPHINSAFPEHVCLIGTALPNGYAQITPRGSTMVFDDDHIALWERGKGSTNAAMQDGTKVTVYFASRSCVPTASCRRAGSRASMAPPGS